MRFRYDEHDLNGFVEELKEDLKATQEIIRVKVKNARSMNMSITIEPQGSGDDFPMGATYEVVAAGEKGKSILEFELRDDLLVVYVNGWGGIFENGAATMAT